MKKTKKNKVGKKNSLFGGATKSLKKLGKGTATGISGLSTTQKVVGGAALVALGLSYLSKRRGNKSVAEETITPDATAAEENLAALDQNQV
ncbi:hypothetical protein [Hymenobacter terrenus]|uniref:hypothetical protein n=1 Tax=Hymenobacter terrenus TaxID=1629124 RepID=UPI000619C322|nr:hypothetical protein [Hymenobacter terrenus]